MASQRDVMDTAAKFLTSLGGLDKTLMVFQYSSKIGLFHLQHQISPSLLQAWSNLASYISDFRIFLRFNGLFPLLQYIRDLELRPPTSSKLRFLLRLENVCNLIYYPLEHTYWLGRHKILPLSERQTNWISIWSCRFWALYVLLHFATLYEQWKLEKGKQQEKEGRKKQRLALFLNLIINICYFPLTIHWSLEKSSFPDVGVGWFGTTAALIQFYQTWKSIS